MVFVKCVDGPLKNQNMEIAEDAVFQTYFSGKNRQAQKHVYEVVETVNGKELRYHHSEPDEDRDGWVD